MPGDSGSGGVVAEASWRRWWPTLKTSLTVAFFVAVAALLVMQARQVEWREVAGVFRSYGAGTIFTAALLAVIGHLLYTTYDLLARRYTGHPLGSLRVMSIAFVSYAFNLNLGPIVGALGIRFRLYSKFGIGKGTVTRVLGFSVVSNWLGYLLIGGTLFTARVVELPASWDLGTTALQGVGAVMILCVIAYVWLCLSARRRSVTVRGLRIELPPTRMAALQLTTSWASWMTMAGILFVLLDMQIPYPTVLGVLLLAAVAALLTHIPAGLGVLEATFVLLLGHLLPSVELLAAVLAYRALYYLMPLVAALAIFLRLEGARRSADSPDPTRCGRRRR